MSGGRRPVEIGAREQQQGITLLRSLGAAVYEIGTKRGRWCPNCKQPVRDHGTRQTPGIPDVFAVIECVSDGLPYKRALWWESKAGQGKASPEQRQFRDLVLETGVDHVLGGVTELFEWLVMVGRLKADNVPHYRRPMARAVHGGAKP